MAVVFAKYKDLMQYLYASYYGRTYRDICDHLKVSDSTARRMIRELRDFFEIHEDDISDTGEKRFRILGIRYQLRDFQQDIQDLGLAADLFEQQGLGDKASRLRTLRNQLLGTLQPAEKRRLEPDLELLGNQEGWAVRPGPRAEVSREKLTLLRHALLSRRLIETDYKRRRDNTVEKIAIEAEGLVWGVRHYMVGYVHGAPSKEPRLFVIANMENIRLLDDHFPTREDFNFKEYVSRSFGVWQGDGQQDVIWRFPVGAADDAMEFHFHPTEQKILLPDGRVEVRFRADGLLEQCHTLFTFEEATLGRSVEIVGPDVLRRRYRAMLEHALGSLNLHDTNL